jgi:3-isopropylmalate dehydratase
LIRNDFGIRCVIAPSFAEIFKTNAMQNGMLPVVLPKKQCEELARDGEEGLELEVDLKKQEVRRPNGRGSFTFKVEPFKRHCLLNGLDDIGLTLQKADKITTFEARRSNSWPWLDGFGYVKSGGKINTKPIKKKKVMDWDW